MANRYVALIPAAGSGSRMGQVLPKQYLPLGGHPMLCHSIAALHRVERIERIFAVLSPGDESWRRHDWSAFASKLTPLHCGGASRCTSVRNGLRQIPELGEEDWVLVHDAARPGLTPALVDRLIDEVGEDPVGGLLALPLPDTLKQADSEARVLRTLPREGVWLAQTPQMFRYGLLTRALAAQPLDAATDEAQVVEALGLRPRLVEGDSRNFKVTYPADLALAEAVLARGER